MNIGIDIDGTIDAFPVTFQHLIAGFKAAADHVYIITGIGADEPTDADYAAKAQYLTAMGIPPSAYYQLVIVGTSPDMTHAQAKAKYIQDNNIGLLIDNNVENIKAAKPFCMALCVWNVKEKADKPGTQGLRSNDSTCPQCGTNLTGMVELKVCPQCGADLSIDTSDGLLQPNDDRLPLV